MINLLTLSRSRKYLFLALWMGVSIFLCSFGLYFYQVFYAPNILHKDAPCGLYIRPGDKMTDLRRVLLAGDYVEDILSFSLVARLLNYDKHMRPGYYVLDADMSNLSAIRLLRSGQQTPVRVVFHGARMLQDLLPKVCASLNITAPELLAYLQADSTATRYGFRPENMVSMFIPNTYYMYWTITPQAFVERMWLEYRRFWTPQRRTQADSLGLSLQDVSTLASIVEAETRYQDEKPRIAGVYLNRLRRGIVLAADPTLIFAVQDFRIRRVLNKHKTMDSPYNTYKYKGLPPGPIRVPEINSLEAVLAAESHHYLYFCAQANFSGRHVFSHTLKEHQHYARRYQRALNKLKIFH